MSCSAIAVCVVFASLFTNGGFESEPPSKGWSIPNDGAWRIEGGSGVGKSRCLVWEASAPCEKTLASFSIPVEPGDSYKVSGRVNVEAIRSGEWSFGLDWFTADGKWIDNSGASRRIDNHPSVSEGWVRYDGGTPPLPSGAATLRIYVYAKPGASGRIRFDDFSVEKSGSRAVEYLVSSAYRDSAVSGTVRFFARVCFNPLRHDLDGLVGEFAFAGADGTRQLRRTRLASADLAMLELPVSDLAPGRHPVDFSLKAQGGETLGSDSLVFTREKRPAQRRVSIDEQRFAIVEGRRFFPIGAYTHSMSPAQLDFYMQGPFNCVKLSNHGISKRILDEFWGRGLRVIIDIRDEIKVITADPSAEKSAGRVAIENVVRAWKDHPATLGWYNNDEAPLSILPDIRLATKWTHEIDPDHPVYAVTDKPSQTRAFLSTYDIIGMDPYPIGNLGGMNDVGIASRWAESCREGMFGSRAMWQVVQAFSWKWFANGVPAGEKARLPTKEEFASMCWQAIAGGANGLILYSFYDFHSRQEPAERESNWRCYCDVLKDVRRMEPVILCDPSPMKVGGIPADVAVRAWQGDGCDWLLVANRTYGPVEAKLGVRGEYSESQSVLGGEVSLVGKSLLAVKLRGLGFAVARLSRVNHDR